MIEREMEDLLAACPEEFFPAYQWTLKGRQHTFAGVGRFDLLFEDQRGTNILVELKAVPVKYPDADQLAKYKDALRAKGETNVWMFLVAPIISGSVAEYLGRIGVEHVEIHEAQYRQVAERHDYTFASERPDPAAAGIPAEGKRTVW